MFISQFCLERNLDTWPSIPHGNVAMAMWKTEALKGCQKAEQSPPGLREEVGKGHVLRGMRDKSSSLAMGRFASY